MANTKDTITSENGKQDIKLRPALIIGLGGTGAQVIKRLRRMFIDRFGRFENIPIVKFLYLDTDPNSLNEMALKVEEFIRLPEAERLDIQFPDASGLYRGILEGNYPHYSWFSIQQLQGHKSVTNGAGTIRQLGRLCFWHHASAIRDRIRSLIDELKAEEVVQFMEREYKKQNVRIDKGVDVHIVTGLAGGTGSGIFLDAAYMARHVLKNVLNIEHYEVNGHLILPGAFRELASTNAMANGYAALKELNHYTYRYAPMNGMAGVFGKPAWDADYTGRKTDRVRFEQVAPFDHCYLIDDCNQDQVQVTRDQLFAMIARSLFLDFTDVFATSKRSNRANVLKNIQDHDERDMPRQFMSFGQSAVVLPHNEIRQFLTLRLAMQAVQQWVGAGSEDLFGSTTSSSSPLQVDAGDEAMATIQRKATDEQLVGAAIGHLGKEAIPKWGLRAADVLTSITVEQRERLTEIPGSIAASYRQGWIAKELKPGAFVGAATDAWRKLKDLFDDQGDTPMKWGEQIRKLASNRARAEKTYRQELHKHILHMATSKEGPAWALCVAQQLRIALSRLKNQFVNEANNAVAIANLLSDTYIINAVSQAGGEGLSVLIEKRIADELKKLQDAVGSSNPFGKKARIDKAATDYLDWCARWCRARVEERSRRLAADLVDGLCSALSDIERQVLDHAARLATIRTEVAKETKEWRQKAARTETVGKLLFDDSILTVLDGKLRSRQGDKYDAAAVAKTVADKLKRPLWEISLSEIPQILIELKSAAEEAIGTLDEQDIADTSFAVYDVLSAQNPDDNELDKILRRATACSSPFIRINMNPPGGQFDASVLKWNPLIGIRSGYNPNDPDRERARVVESLIRIGASRDHFKHIQDSSQIIFFREMGGFPLRAIQGVEDIKLAYEDHSASKDLPLHILRDDLAEVYPDLLPPNGELQERAKMIATVGIPLGFIVQQGVLRADGLKQIDQLWGYTRQIFELNETEFVPLVANVDQLASKLAYALALVAELEKVIAEAMKVAKPDEKRNYALKLQEHLKQYEERLREESQGANPKTLPQYQVERDRVLKFIRQYGLVGETAS